MKAPAQWDILLKAAHVPNRAGIDPRHSPCWGGLAQPWACCAGGCYAQAWCFAGLRPQLSSPLGGVVSGLSPGSSRPTCVFFRRAHLKECFETLKRNIPNVDDKKTSNLSVLRSALRYIQVRAAPGAGGVQRRGETPLLEVLCQPQIILTSSGDGREQAVQVIWGIQAEWTAVAPLGSAEF